MEVMEVGCSVPGWGTSFSTGLGSWKEEQHIISSMQMGVTLGKSGKTPNILGWMRSIITANFSKKGISASITLLLVHTLPIVNEISLLRQYHSYLVLGFTIPTPKEGTKFIYQTQGVRNEQIWGRGERCLHLSPDTSTHKHLFQEYSFHSKSDMQNSCNSGVKQYYCSWLGKKSLRN